MAKMVDRVMDSMKNPEKIRNIAICAHIDHGKTTFSDNLLSGAGMMSEELAGKALQLDFHEDEQERGITIDSAAVSMVHTVEGKDYLINLIDTPGHVDFGGDVTRAMRAVDGSITLVCAVEGIMPQTETVLKQALREKVKPILFINKVDRLIKEVKLTPEKMQEKFINIIRSVNEFIKGITPEDYNKGWNVKVEDGSVCFGSAFHNWALSLSYMQKKGITFKDVIDFYEKDDVEGLRKKAPLHEVVLDAVIKHHPNPIQAQSYRIPKIWRGDKESEFGRDLLSCNPNGTLSFVVTKVVVDPQAGEIAAGRLFSGTMNKGSEVYLNTGKINTKIQQIYIYNGAKREIVDKVPAGNIVGVGGLKNVYPGETVSVGEVEPFEKISHLFEPVITKAIEAKKPSDLPKLIEVLTQISKEDPSIVIEINNETGEQLISGMGELHLEVLENRIISEKHVEITSSPPIVVYRETVTVESQEAEGKSPNKHNKLKFIVEPMNELLTKAIKKGDIAEGRVKKKHKDVIEALVAAGMDTKAAKKVRHIFKGCMLVDDTRGIVHIGEIIEMVMDMFEDVINKGPLAHEPGLDIKVRLTDAKLHEDAIHRGPAQLYPAVREGIREAIKTAKAVIYEPIQTLQFESPEEYMGEVSKLISNKRGKLIDVVQEGTQVTITGELPVAEMFGLSSELRSATGGRGLFSVVDQTFEPVPRELQDALIKRIRQRKGLGENE